MLTAALLIFGIAIAGEWHEMQRRRANEVQAVTVDGEPTDAELDRLYDELNA